jgi:S1-C subfamily serine protease
MDTLVTVTPPGHGSCHGVLVEYNESPAVLTAGHCLDTPVLNVEFYDGSTATAHRTKVDEALDLGLVVFNPALQKPVSLAPIGDITELGKPVWAVGMFMIGTDPFCVKSGIVSKNTTDGNKRLTYLDMHGFYGDSGGPVFNIYGELTCIQHHMAYRVYFARAGPISSVTSVVVPLHKMQCTNSIGIKEFLEE